MRVARRQPDDGHRRTLCFCSDLLRNELCPVEPSSSTTAVSSLVKPRWPAKSCFGLGFSALIPLVKLWFMIRQARARFLPSTDRVGADIIRISRRSKGGRAPLSAQAGGVSSWLWSCINQPSSPLHAATSSLSTSSPSLSSCSLSPPKIYFDYGKTCRVIILR